MAKLRKRAWMKLSEAAEMLSNLTGETVTFNDLLRYGEEGTLTLSFYFLEPLPVHAESYKVFDEPEIGISAWERLRHCPDHTLYKGGANNEFPHEISGLWEIRSTDTAKILFVHGAETRDESEILARAIPRITEYAENGPFWRYLHVFSIGMNRVQTAIIHHQDIPANTLVCIRPEMIEQIIDETGEPNESNTGTAISQPDADRQHYPPHLEALTIAWRKYWQNADPTDRTACPRKPDVVAWLMEQGFSAKNADAGATIIKPQWATDKGW